MRYVIGIIALALAFFVGTSFAAQLEQTLSGGDVLTVNCDGQRLDQQRLNQTTRRLTCVGDPVPTPTPTNTPVPPTPTPVPPTPTPGSGHDNTVWHGPSGNTHEHGDAPASWWPTSGPCAGIGFAQMAIGREDHVFYKHYTGQTSNGVQISVINHVAPNSSTEGGLHDGRSHGDHDETILFRDLSGNVSCWAGLADYSPQGQPITAPITIFIKPCDGGGPQGPVILISCTYLNESWYEEPGAGWCDNSTHVNGPWTDPNGIRRGDGTSRHMEVSCYAPRLPGPNAIFVASTLAQDCIVQFNICQFKAVVTSFAKDYGSVSGPN